MKNTATGCHLSLLLLLAAWLGGCASLPPGSDFPKTPSVAFAHPEQTVVGKKFEQATQAHGGASGFRILNMGIDGFLTRAQMINSAERSLDLQYFIFRADETGQFLADALLRAADRGVRIRILVDDGETAPGDEKLAALQAHPKIALRIFNPFAYRGHMELFRFTEFLFHKSRLDYRMHNKLLVVDNALALIGGRNIGDPYFQIDPELQLGDDDVFSVGPVVKQLSATFDDYWNSASAIPAQALEPALEKTPEQALSALRQQLAEHRQKLQADGTDYVARIASGEPLAGMISGALPLVWAPAQVVCDSPEKSKVEKGEIVGQLMHRAVAKRVAEVQSELLIITPYFIPGAEGMKLLQDLRQRQVRVRVLTNSLMSTNVLAAHAGYMHYRQPLLESGVELYEIRDLLGSAKGSGQSKAMSRFGNYALHAKLFVFDRKRLFIGSMNFDQRSMHLNTEVGLIIDSPELAQQIAARFEAFAKPSNSYHLLLPAEESGAPPGLRWRTEEGGKTVDYTEEPAQSGWRRFKANWLSLLPLDGEL
ncbi:MAG TPA: phospholipase D family protein [Rhodocyclaceae bacterium]|nr:phospholipase D family protein [Rhodocyclaceae bacterium]